MTEKLIYALLKNGYKEMISRGEENGYRIYYDMTTSLVNAVIFVDAIKYSMSFHEQFRKSFQENMQARNLISNDMLILCVNSKGADITEQMAVSMQACSTNNKAWIYDEGTEQLYIADTQIEEFYGLKRLIDDAKNITESELEAARTETADVQETVPMKERITKAFRELPKASATLVIINVLVFILCVATGTVLYSYGGAGLKLLTGPDQYYRVISSLFLHVNGVHLFSNMLLLYFAGEIVEKAVKPWWFLLIYFASGIIGTGCVFVSDYINDTQVVVIGASGAVYGILGALLALVLFKRINTQYARLPRVVLAIFISIYSGFSQENVANLAHIGGVVSGFVIGLICCLIYRKSVGEKKNED